MIKKCAIGMLLLLIMACNSKDAPLYNMRQDHIYFALADSSSSDHDAHRYLDSMFYSFATELEPTKEKKIKIPISLIGQAQTGDRNYNLAINKAETTIDLSLVDLSEPIFRGGNYRDTLVVTIKYTPEFKKSTYKLALRLLDNENFKAESTVNSQITISVTDRLFEPEWWPNWRIYFGEFRSEVYRQWIIIYRPGLDPTKPFYGEKAGFSWSNMPENTFTDTYPVTFYYINELKKYFETHAVYPDGDTNKPRIYLP